MSRTCRIRSADRTSSNVARKAATSWRWQIGHKTNGIGQDNLVQTGASSLSRIVGSNVANNISSAMTSAPVKRLNNVDFPALGIADQCDHWPWGLLPPATGAGRASFAPPPILCEAAHHAIADHPAVGLNLRFAGAAKKNQSRRVAVQGGSNCAPIGRLDNHRCANSTCNRPSAVAARFTKNFEDQPGAVDHFRFDGFFQIALLNGGQTAIDDQQFRVVQTKHFGDFFHLACAK